MTVHPIPQRPRRTARDWVGRVLGPLFVIATGIVLGVQYARPDKRMLALLAAMVVFGVAWRLEMVSALGVLVLTLPYPKANSFGNSNLALIALLAIIWLMRLVQRQSAPLARTPVDAAVIGLMIAFVISTYNVDPRNVRYALTTLQLLAGGIALFYLVTTNLRTEADLRKMHAFQLTALVTMCLFAIYELNHPSGALVPGWIEFHGSTGEDFETTNVRVGGPFFDYELLAEFCAISLLLVIYMMVRATSATKRVLIGGVLLLDVFVLFTTVTRGAIFSLAATMVYMLWIVRRQLKVVPVTILAVIVLAGFLGTNFFVSHYTRSGNLIERLEATTFYGAVPDSRRTAWADGWERFLQKPILGHGPYYPAQEGTRTWLWPHNGYLYIANLTGVIGLALYLWIMWTLFRISRPPTDRLDDPSYARSFLIVARLQLVLFAVDQIKIDFLRNPIYQFQVWLLFASIVAAYQIARTSSEREAPALEPAA
jgi:O-antigen ligase